MADGLSEKGYDVTITTYGDYPDHYEYNSKIKRYKIAPNKNKIIKMFCIWHYFLTVKADWVISYCQRQNVMCLEALFFNSEANQCCRRSPAS